MLVLVLVAAVAVAESLSKNTNDQSAYTRALTRDSTHTQTSSQFKIRSYKPSKHSSKLLVQLDVCAPQSRRKGLPSDSLWGEADAVTTGPDGDAVLAKRINNCLSHLVVVRVKVKHIANDTRKSLKEQDAESR